VDASDPDAQPHHHGGICIQPYSMRCAGANAHPPPAGSIWRASGLALLGGVEQPRLPADVAVRAACGGNLNRPFEASEEWFGIAWIYTAPRSCSWLRTICVGILVQEAEYRRSIVVPLRLEVAACQEDPRFA
jgi:hypothetical protein